MPGGIDEGPGGLEPGLGMDEPGMGSRAAAAGFAIARITVRSGSAPLKSSAASTFIDTLSCGIAS